MSFLGALGPIGSALSTVGAMIPNQERRIVDATVTPTGNFRQAGQVGNLYAGYNYDENIRTVSEPGVAKQIFTTAGMMLKLGSDAMDSMYTDKQLAEMPGAYAPENRPGYRGRVVGNEAPITLYGDVGTYTGA